MRPTFPQHSAATTPWKAAHNRALTGPSSHERRIVAQIAGLQVTIDTLADEDGRVDAHAAAVIVGPMASALIETLNYDRGRIDGGRVCEWIEHVTTEAGWDLQTETYFTTTEEEG